MKFYTKISIAVLVMSALILGALPQGAVAQFVSYYGPTYYSSYNARPIWNKVNNLTVVQGETVSVGVSAIDDNGDALFYSAVQLPQGGRFDPATRVFSMTPNFTQLGSFPVTLAVTDNKSTAVTTTFYVNVTINYGHYVYGGGDVDEYFNQAPYFSTNVSYYQAQSGTELRFTVNAIDPEGDTIRYRVSELPAGASFDGATRTFSWTPARSQRGTYTITFTATDALRTSIPFTVTIVVDGGTAVVTQPLPTGYGSLYPTQYLGSGTPYFASVAPSAAYAGTIMTYQARAVDPEGGFVRYALTYAPTGAYVNAESGVIVWTVPANAVSGAVKFAVSATDATGLMGTQEFSVMVSGGTPTVKTVYSAPKTTAQVQYVAAPTTSFAPVVASDAVYITTGRTVVPANYQYVNAGQGAYTANAYGLLVGTNATVYGAPLPVTAAPLEIFNIAVRVSGNKEMIVSWDTTKPSQGEVVFGYSSQSRGSDLNRTILNYDFTTGVLKNTATRHETSLGTLDLNQTYYLRVISRADNQTEISREIVFIPMTTEEGRIIIDQRPGAASAVGTLGSFLISGGFLFFLVLVIIGLIAYLIVMSRRPVVKTVAHHEEIPLNIHHPAERH